MTHNSEQETAQPFEKIVRTAAKLPPKRSDIPRQQPYRPRKPQDQKEAACK